MIDCGKRTLMPGLIDSHVHAIHSEVNIRFLEAMPLTLITARAATRLRAMLDRGFTTVRDTGGADWGIKTAIETGHIVGPRLFIAGPVDRSDRRPFGFAPPHQLWRRLRLLQRPAVQIRDRRRRR